MLEALRSLHATYIAGHLAAARAACGALTAVASATAADGLDTIIEANNSSSTHNTMLAILGGTSANANTAAAATAPALMACDVGMSLGLQPAAPAYSSANMHVPSDQGLLGQSLGLGLGLHAGIATADGGALADTTRLGQSGTAAARLH